MQKTRAQKSQAIPSVPLIIRPLSAAVQRVGRDVLHGVHTAPVRGQHGQILRHSQGPPPLPGIYISQSKTTFDF